MKIGKGKKPAGDLDEEFQKEKGEKEGRRIISCKSY